MPIYEFYCPDCHRVFNFLSRRVDTEKRPACPRCARPDLTRRVSLFAISRGRKEEPASPEAPPDVDEARLEQAMASLAHEAEGIDEDDPRQAATLMRKLFDASGLPMGAPVQEAIRRMEAGESPDKIEEEMGDVLEDPFAGAGATPGERRATLAGLRRRVLPPTTDPELYEM
jgi:putative FmdB family regulatory protein